MLRLNKAIFVYQARLLLIKTYNKWKDPMTKYKLGRAMRKRAYADSECLDQPARPRSLIRVLTESLNTINCFNGEHMPGRDCAYADGVHPHILRMLEGTFSLVMDHLV